MGSHRATSASRALFLAFVLGAALAAVPTHGFIFVSNGGYNKGARPVSHAPIWTSNKLTFYVNSNQSAYGGGLTSGVTSSDFVNAVQSAIRGWAAACKADFQVVYGGTTSSLKTSADHVAVIAWDNRTTGQGNMYADTSILAAATPALSSVTGVDCDIVVNGESGPFGVNGESGKYDLISVLTHEIGHCLGLDHTVEPPTYTSTNTILNNAVMYPSTPPSSTRQRTLSQDEHDAMGCVYPKGQALRSGASCSSYHGSNGGAALSGSVSGGPSASTAVACGTEADAVTIRAIDGAGEGCITGVFASTSRESPSARSQSGFPSRSSFLSSSIVELLAIAGVGLLLLRRRRSRALFLGPLLLFAICEQGHAKWSAELGAEYRFVSPLLFNKFAQLNTADGIWEKVSKDEIYSRTIDGLFTLAFSDYRTRGSLWEWRFFFHYTVPLNLIEEGKTGATAVNVVKTTSLGGFDGGPLLRLYLAKPGPTTAFFIEAGVGVGRATASQEIKGTATSSLTAAVTTLEVLGNLGMNYRLFSWLTLQLKGGYARQRSTIFAVTSASGPLYSGIKEGDRLQASDGGVYKDLTLNRTGFLITLATVWPL